MRKNTAIILFGVIPIWADSATTTSDAIADTMKVAVDSATATGVVTTQSQSETGAATDTIFPVTPQRRELLNKYSSFSFKWSLFYDFFQWALLLVILFTGLSKRFLDIAEKVSGRKSVQFLMYILILFVFLTVVSLPLDFSVIILSNITIRCRIKRWGLVWRLGQSDSD
jgi:hypothetical protein